MNNQTTLKSIDKSFQHFLSFGLKTYLRNLSFITILLLFVLSNTGYSQTIASGSSSNSSYLLCSNPSGPGACGSNSYGQLGDGTLINRINAFPVGGLTDITAFTGGAYHSLFLKNDSTVWACGRNNGGQLGDGTNINKTISVQVNGLTDITAIASGNYHSLFLKNDSTVWSCGTNDFGQLGIGTYINQNTPVHVSGLTGIVAIAAGGNFSLFLKNDGTVWACGRNLNGQLGDGTNISKITPVQVSGLTGVIAISAGLTHSLFLKNDSTVWACGLNNYGQLGDGSSIDKTLVTQVSGLTGITALAGGGYHSLFLKNDSTVWACGYNNNGQLGDGTNINKTTATQINSLSGITVLADGAYHSLFLKNDNTVWACGNNSYGQLGNGTNSNSNIPVQLLPCCINPDIPILTASINTSCAQVPTILSIVSGNLNDAAFWQWYSDSCNGAIVGTGTSIAVNPLVTTTYYVRGVGGCIILSVCASITVNSSLPSPTITGGPIFSSTGTLHAGNYSSYLWSTGASTSSINITTTGTYTVTVYDANGCTGSTSQFDIVNTQTVASGSSSAASYFLCSNLSPPLACGNNYYGQLGDGTNLNRTVVAQVNGLTGITAVSGANGHTLFLKNDSTVWACGYNYYGQLGNGTNTSSNTPLKVTGLNGIIAIAAGESYSLFLKNDGTVWACGFNYYGQLGDGTTLNKTLPVQVSGLADITAIACGKVHSLFLKNDGTVWSCGNNQFGQLGYGTFLSSSTPAPVTGLKGVIAIAAGGYHSLFLKKNGTVRACGYNHYGQLGNGTYTKKYNFIVVHGLTGIVAVGAGGNYSLFLKNDSTVWGCGSNSAGQLGNGTSNQNIAVVINGLSGVTSITAGYEHSLFLINNSTVWACGKNNFGQLGNWTTTNSSSPVQIFPCCSLPNIPTLTASVNSTCTAIPITLSILSGNLNDATQWQWYSDSCNGSIVGTGTSIIVTPSVTTTYYVRGIGGCVFPGGCASITVVISIQPPTITGNTSFCFQDSTTLDAGSYSSYLWSTGATTQTISVDSATTYTVTVTNTTACSSSASILITDGPVAISTTNIAQDSAVANWTSVGTGVTYFIEKRLVGALTFDLGQTTNNTAFNLINLLSDTNYEWHVRMVCASGHYSEWSALMPFSTLNAVCTKKPDGLFTDNISFNQVKVNWNPLNQIPDNYYISYRFVGAPIWSVVTGPGILNNAILTGLTAASNYEWRLRGQCGLVAPFEYSLWSDTAYFSTMAVGLEDNLAGTTNALALYPNPTTGLVNLIFNAHENKMGKVEIYNTLSELIYSKSVEINSGENNQAIDLSNAVIGIYFLQLKIADQTYNMKIVKE